MYQPDLERPRSVLDLPKPKHKMEGEDFILDVVFAAYKFVFRNFAAFLLYAFVPIIVSSLPIAVVLLSSITHTVDNDFIAWMGIDPNLYPQFPTLIWVSSTAAATVISIVLNIAFFLISASFAVAWHRRYLLGPIQSSPAELFNWRLRNLRFIGYCVIFFGLEKLSVAFARIFGIGLKETIESEFVILIIMFAVAVALISLLVGFLLVFPATAIDDTRTGLLEARKYSHGHKWKIFINLGFGIGVPLGFVLWAFGAGVNSQSVLNYWVGSIPGSAFVILLANLINFMILALFVTVLSMFYKKLVDSSATTAEPEGSSPA